MSSAISMTTLGFFCAGPYVIEVDHDCLIACMIAATMLGFAPHRQILPLMSSRISSTFLALPSAIRPAAEQICSACNSRTGTRRGR